jgi:hypothetical protein
MKLRQRLGLTHPAEGLAITAEDHILSTNSPTTYDPYLQPPLNTISHYNAIDTSNTTDSEQDNEQGTRDREADQEYEQRLTRSPVTSVETDPGPDTPSPIDNLRWLFEECENARGNCRILGESLLHANSDSVLKDSLIKV